MASPALTPADVAVDVGSGEAAGAASEAAPTPPPKKVSSRALAHDYASSRSMVGGGHTGGRKKPSPQRAPSGGGGGASSSSSMDGGEGQAGEGGEGDDAVPPNDGQPAEYPTRAKRRSMRMRPWSNTIDKHPTPSEEREPKGWTLSHILGKANWGTRIAKAFAPHLSLADPNRIRVGVRVRPHNEQEAKRGEKERFRDFFQFAGSQLRITNPKPAPGQEGKAEEYAFDALYTPEDGTSKVFQDLALPLVHLVCAGYNGTIFAYGQTGSGKTHSMMGNSSDPGITPRVTSELFDTLKQLSATGKATYEVKCSYLQIYREVRREACVAKGAAGVCVAAREACVAAREAGVVEGGVAARDACGPRLPATALPCMHAAHGCLRPPCMRTRPPCTPCEARCPPLAIPPSPLHTRAPAGVARPAGWHQG